MSSSAASPTRICAATRRRGAGEALPRSRSGGFPAHPVDAVHKPLKNCFCVQFISNVSGRRPSAFPNGGFAQLDDLLERHHPVPIGRLRIKAVFGEAFTNAIKHSLTLIQHQIDDLFSTPRTLFRRRALGDPAAIRKSPEPQAKVLVRGFQNWVEDGDTHECRRKRDSLKSNRPPAEIIGHHGSFDRSRRPADEQAM